MQPVQISRKRHHYRDLLSRMDITLWVRRDDVSQQIVHFDTVTQGDIAADIVSDKQQHDDSVTDISPNLPASNAAASATSSTITSNTDISSVSVTGNSQTEVNSDNNQSSHHVKCAPDTASNNNAVINKSLLGTSIGTQDAVGQTQPSEKQAELHTQTEAQPAFTLYALCYKHSVILCDGSGLHTEQTSALWQSIQHALQSSLHQLSFPLTDAINDTDVMSHECAQASVAGWLYQLGQLTDKETQCVLLGNTTAPVPETITILSGLSSMLTNPQNKKTLWELIK